jgi:shikimate dehydrogenase
MHKSVGVSPVGKELLSLCDTAVDLIYEPKKSEFLRLAEEAGKQIVNGESMLFYQAYYSDCIYLKIQPHARTAKELFEKYKKEHTL